MNILLLLVAAFLGSSEACSCAPFPSQKESFCSSDFVSHIKVISMTDPNKDSDGLLNIIYNVEHLCTYKKPLILKQLSNKIATASNSAACGVELTVGTEYLIGGSVYEDGTLHIYLCGIVQKWSTVSAVDRIALKRYKC